MRNCLFAVCSIVVEIKRQLRRVVRPLGSRKLGRELGPKGSRRSRSGREAREQSGTGHSARCLEQTCPRLSVKGSAFSEAWTAKGKRKSDSQHVTLEIGTLR